MGNIIQDVIPFGGMNTDDDLHLFPDGDYRYAENVRNATSEEGYIGAFENILGNLKVTNAGLKRFYTLSGKYDVPSNAPQICIGSCIDITTNCVYYAVHTPQFAITNKFFILDCIFEYNKDLNTISTVLSDVTPVNTASDTITFEKHLNFSTDYPINGMFVVNGMLFWNDGYNPPRKINIAKAKNFTKSIETRFAFTDNYFSNGSVGFIVTQTIYDSFSIGDRIQVFQNIGATYPEYDGTTQIVNKVIDTGIYIIVVNKPYMGNTTVQGGYIYKSYGGYSIPFKEVFMDRIKHPPIFPITFLYADDSDKRINNINKKQFQFAYKYIYDDKEESVLSSISKVSNITTNQNEIINSVNSVNNVLLLNINTGSNNVKSIKIYARSTSETNGDNPVVVNCNNSDWWFVDEVIKYDNDNSLILNDDINYQYSFYNSQNKQYGDQADLNRPFDYVPQICATSEIVENSRIVDGDIIEGYDNTKVDISVNIIKKEVRFDYTQSVVSSRYNTDYSYEDTHHYVFQTKITLPDISELEINDVIEFKITKTATSNFITEIIQFVIDENSYYNYPSFTKNAIYEIFKAKGYFRAGFKAWGEGAHQIASLESFCLIAESGICTDNPTLVDASFGFPFNINIITSKNSYIDNRNNSGWGQLVKDFYINSLTDNTPVYNNNDIIFLQCGTNLFDDTVQVPDNVRYWLNDKFTLNFKTGEDYYIPNKSLKTGDTISLGVVYYDRAERSSFVNKIGDFNIPLNVDSALFVYNPKVIINSIPPTWATSYEIVLSRSNNISYFLQYIAGDITTDGGYSKLDVGANIASTNTLYGRTIIEPYIWEKGDRIRLLGDVSSSFYSSSYDYEIIKADASNVWFNLITSPSTMGTIFYEIYRPAKTDKEIIYYGTGDKYAIENNYHLGLEQNQTVSQPAIIQTTIGNCYVIKGINGEYRESVNANDFFKSDGSDIGRPNIANVNAKQQHLFNHIRFSGQLFQNTQINNLSRNDASDYIQVSSKFGAITKLVEIGYVLKVLQEKNLNSVYLSRTQLTNTDGSTNLSAVNTPLGTINPSESLYGSKYPRSVIRNNRSLYFLDTMQGAFIKDDNNGSEQISETRKMNRFFTDLCRKIESGLYTVVMTGSYDIRHEEAIFNVSLTLIASPYTVTYYTIAYSEIKNKFTTFYTYNTEQLEDIGQQLISFKNGELYLHNKTTSYNEFYGVDYPQKITIVGNKNPKFNKIFTNTAIRTNGEWNVPEMRILPTLNYPIGMKSRLKKAKFVNKEGVQYASFMNDMTDPRYATPSEALINGRPLRGECVEIDYQNESTDKCVTLMFTIGMTNSELGV